MENLKTKQDVMLDKINETKILLRKALFYSVKKKFSSNKDIQEIRIQIMIERIASILSNVYYEAILDVKKADLKGKALDDLMAQMNDLLKVLLVNALTTKDGVSMWEQVLAHYEEEPDELTKMAGMTLLALPDEQKNVLSQANFYMDNIEDVCDNAQDIINAKLDAIAYFGEDFIEAPESIQNAIIDIIFNKGITGFEKEGSLTNNLKQNLADKDYAEAAVNTCYLTASKGLMKRNVYRFISSLQDLTKRDRTQALSQYEPYYKDVLALFTGNKSEYDLLEQAWQNAYDGTCHGFFRHLS